MEGPAVRGWPIRLFDPTVPLKYWRRSTLVVTDGDRRRVIEGMFHEGDRFWDFASRFGTLMALSVCLATLGLTANSAAVIIGAMIVAPLMGPVLGVAASIVMGWPKRMVRQAVIVAVGAAGAIALAALLSALLPGEMTSPPSELLARTEPNILDLAVAMAAGAVGAYTIVRREAAEAMAGAAIAVALVPPLATVGVSLEAGRFDMAAGAVLLVLANVVGVVFSGSMTFMAVGFVPGMAMSSLRRGWLPGMRWVAAAVILMVFPLQWNGPGVLAPPPEHTDVQEVVDAWSGGTDSDVEVVEVVVAMEEGVAMVDVVVAAPGQLPDVDYLAADLAEELGRPVDLDLQHVASYSTKATAGG